ncbi:MAG: phytoene desaturase, partial [Chitinophagaceae bacterium]
MYSIVKAMYELALELGVQFHFNEEVMNIVVDDHTATSVLTACLPAHVDNNVPSDRISTEYKADVIIGAADYHFIETVLLPAQYRSYSENYWDKRVLAPSCLLYYVGLNKRLDNILHHTLFFDVPFEKHAEEIYTTRQWPDSPLFYVSATSVTDDTVAPAGCENLFFLVPVAAGLEGDTDELRDRYFDLIVKRMEKAMGQSIKDAIVYKKSFSTRDFIHEYNSFKGNAYGLANTLLQTAVLKPSCRSKKVRNLFYTGQLTVPGPGVPPSLISGEVVSGEVLRHF